MSGARQSPRPRNARSAAQRALEQLEKGRVERLRDALDDLDLEPREKAFANDLATGVVRNERLLDFALQQCVERRLPADPRVLAALRLGAFQLLFLASIPARAAVNETVSLVQKERGFCNAVLRRLAGMVAPRAADPSASELEIALAPDRALLLAAPGLRRVPDVLALRHGLPDFLVQRWRTAHGDAATAAIAIAASSEPMLFLRACGGRDAVTLQAELAAEGVQCAVTAHPLVLRCDSGAPMRTKAFVDGAFVVQDPTAVRAAEAVGATPGMRIVDLCAAPGTKATLLAERVRPDGVVFAFDPDPARRARIEENAARLRLQPFLRVVADSKELPIADAVLADVPCSNTGVLARRVEVRRRIGPRTMAELVPLQRRLLEQALQLTRADGRTVYSTCSIEPEENGDLVAAVASSRGATVLQTELTLPRAGVGDGGFFAVLRPSGVAGVSAPAAGG